jgi:NADH-quinone oxidoreductase subunit I
MGYLTDSLRALAFTMKSAFRKPVTVHYPAEKRERAVRYRNSFALLHEENGDEACVGCLQCERICPSQVITVVAEKRESAVTGKRRGYAKDFTLDLNACIFCELCVQVCPTDAIVMTRQAETPAYSREELVLTMDKLYANETSKPRTWGKASVLMEMQDPKRGQAPPPAQPAAEPAKDEPAPTKPKAEALPG